MTHEQTARAMVEQIWESVIYNKGTIEQIIAAALAAKDERIEALEREVEELEAELAEAARQGEP